MVYKYKNQPTNRQLKASELIRREIATIFIKLEVYHPALEGLSLTITDVKISADLKIATIFIYPVKPSIDNGLIKLLNFLAPEYRKKLIHRIKLKHAPAIRFVADKNIDSKIIMEKKIGVD